jgi:Flp pilus assembly protein TadD
LAYDAAGDRPRARKAMRKALALDAKANLNSN